MIYKTGLEIIEPDNWVNFVFDLPGCFSQARTKKDAIDNSTESIKEYLNWREGYNYSESNQTEPIQFEIVEKFDKLIYEGNYIINAFFEADKQIFLPEEIYQIEWLLDCSRNDLANILKTLTTDQLDQTIKGEVQKNIRGVLRHIATAEVWLLESINLAFDRSEIPVETFEALSKTRNYTVSILEKFINNDTIAIRKSEQWSPRKVIRRMLWHERIHTQQIRKYLKLLNSGIVNE